MASRTRRPLAKYWIQKVLFLRYTPIVFSFHSQLTYKIPPFVTATMHVNLLRFLHSGLVSPSPRSTTFSIKEKSIQSSLSGAKNTSTVKPVSRPKPRRRGTLSPRKQNQALVLPHELSGAESHLRGP